jgi:hypothetical protein
MDYNIEYKKYVLHDGDSLVLSSVFPHCWHNPYQDPAVYLFIMIPGDAGELSEEVHLKTVADYNG